ncbi:hypothetical protein ACI2OX_08000 [Bacillus sp. N9]
MYQPLIGPICTSMYSTLWHAVEENRLWSEQWNHYHLMNLLGLNLQEIYKARLKLEGIGLLKTYMKNERDARSFVYELHPPLSRSNFYRRDVKYLFISKARTVSVFKIKRFFSDKSIDTKQFHDITRSFQDVFTSYGTEMLHQTDGHEASELDEGQQFLKRERTTPIRIDETEFNFDLLFAGLTEMMVPRKVFTKEVKEAIAKLSFYME